MKRITTFIIFLCLVVGSVVSIKVIASMRTNSYRVFFWQTIGMIADNSDFITPILVKDLQGIAKIFKDDSDVKKSFESAKKQHDLIKQNMQRLRKFPKQYKEAYNFLLELYSGYQQLYVAFDSEDGMSGWRIFTINQSMHQILAKIEVLIPPE